MRALIVEDEAPDREALIEVLTDLGFEIDDVHNGRTALVEMGERPYDLIVLDILLPQVDGFEVMSKMKVDHPELIARTVVVSRVATEDMQVFFPGCNVLQKPFDRRAMIETVSRIVGEPKTS